MARSLNKVSLLGNVGNDPEIRTTQGGNKCAQFSLATGRQWRDASGAEQSSTQWHRCVAWDSKTVKLADVVEKYVRKGSPLYVEGEIEYRQWQDKDGQTRHTTEIKVREVILLGGRGGSEDDEKKELYPRNEKPAPTRTPVPVNSYDGEESELPF